jgi:DNA-binding MarR family transcriptional regulator
MPKPTASVPPAVDRVDTRFLETLVGYNARRAALAVIEHFIVQMEPFGMRPVDFSVASVIVHNPGITSRQLCTALGILPPNLVPLINALVKRGLITRKPHPHDRRAMGLHPTAAGLTLMQQAEKTAVKLEKHTSARLTTAERAQLIQLLKKVYIEPPTDGATR